MHFERVQYHELKVVGILCKTSRRYGACYQDILHLWQKWARESLILQIPHRVSDHIYNIYTDYAADDVSSFSVILGCQVSSLKVIPEGMTSRVFPPVTFACYEQVEVWEEVNQEKAYERNYIYDFELYDPTAIDLEQQRVITMISIK